MIPSKYQQAVYDFLTDGTGNAVISAVAGSGKTTTLLEGMKRVKDKSILFMAFNRSIAQELKHRVTNPNAEVKTVHGFGLSALIREYGKPEILASKYYNIAKEIKIPPHIENPKGYINRVVQLCDLARLNMYLEEGKVQELAEKHNVEILNGECQHALDIIKVGVQNVKTIDFTDMIFMPNYYDIPTNTFDLVFVDECQDLGTCQRLLMLKAMKKNGRFIGVGDFFQSIYGFSGADSDSFNKIEALPNTIKLPLSVCYRCGTDIIDLAKTIVPQITAYEGSKKGLVNHNSSVKDIEDGDMVLCRQTYPLVRLCMQFLAEGRKAMVMGGDIGKNLINLIEETERKREDRTLQNMYNRLYADLEKLAVSIAKRQRLTVEEAKETSTWTVANEKIEVLELLSRGCETVEEIVEKIKGIFSEERAGIVLSTIHKSKGLEADRVFIIHEELMPSKYAKKAWELEQESNLRYVAYTRAKSFLGFVTDFDAWADRPQKTQVTAVEKRAASNFVGTVGSKVRTTLTVLEAKEIVTSFGPTMVYEMVDDRGNLFSKFGEISGRFIISQHKEIAKGTMLTFNATVKKHHEYNGEKITVISSLAKF